MYRLFVINNSKEKCRDFRKAIGISKNKNLILCCVLDKHCGTYFKRKHVISLTLTIFGSVFT
jgi:hypothetical protein